MYLVYAVARSADAADDPPCNSQRRIDVLPGMVYLTAPFFFCAKVCPEETLAPFVKESPCLSVTFARPPGQPDDENPDRYGEDSPLNFVEEGSDPLQDALKELAEEDERAYRLSRSEIGLIVSSVVCSVLFVIVGFVVVCKCTSISQRASMISPYLRAAGATAPATGTSPINAAAYAQSPAATAALIPSTQASGYVTHHVTPSAPRGTLAPLTPKTPKAVGVAPPLKYSQAAMSSPRFAAVVGAPTSSSKLSSSMNRQLSRQPSREKRRTDDSV